MLKIEGVSKLFNPGTPDEKVALSRINLNLKDGDFVTVIGSNGAGKSTLMNIISGVMTPDLGKYGLTGSKSKPCRNIAVRHGSAACFRTRWQAPLQR